MKPVIRAAEMRAAEQAVWDADPGVDLMSRAAHAVAKVASEVAPEGPVLVVAGPGNNGGDGLFAAAELAGSRDVSVWLAAGSGHEEGLAAARAAGCVEVDTSGAMEALAEADLVIDAFTGLGSRPGLPDDVLTLAGAARVMGVPVLSVDHPSGLATDSGAAHPSFVATDTVTFAALKPCHVVQPAAGRCGRVHVVDIGVEIDDANVHRIEESDLARWWPVPDGTSHKYNRGVVLLDTGSEQYPGAALLGIAGALHSGAGMVRYGGPAPRDLVLGRYPSVVTGEGRCQAMVIGSGWDGPDERRSTLARNRGVPVVADAGALQGLPDDVEGWLLTPHAGELAQLLGVERDEVEADPIRHARKAARLTDATVLLKGGAQFVAEPSGRVTVALPGPAWTAQAGSGDVLAGVCGTLLAAGLPAWQAGAMGASLQALAAEWHPGPHPPDKLAEQFPMVIQALAMASISTSTPLGSAETWTAERAG